MADTPNLIATLNQEIRSASVGRMDKNEQTLSSTGALALFNKQTASPSGILTAEHKAALARSFGNDVKLGVINYENVSLLSARTCDVQVGGPQSALMTVTFATLGFGLAMIPASHYNNLMSYETVLQRSLQNRYKKLAVQLDTLCRNKLESDKNQVWGGTTVFYANSGNALRVPLASQGDSYNAFPSIMETLNFDSSNLDILTNPRGMMSVRKLMSNGSNNADNTAYQFGNQNFFQSNRVTSGSGVNSTGYIVAPDTCAIMTRLDPDALMGHTAGDGTQWFTTANVPFAGIDMGVRYKSRCDDAAALTAAALSVTEAETGLVNLTATLVESWLFTVDVALVTAYNSDATTLPKPILKYEFLSS